MARADRRRPEPAAKGALRASRGEGQAAMDDEEYYFDEAYGSDEAHDIEQGGEAVMHSFKYRKDLNFKPCNVVARCGERWLVLHNGESFKVKDDNLWHPQHLNEWMGATVKDTLDAIVDVVIGDCIADIADAKREADDMAEAAPLAAEEPGELEQRESFEQWEERAEQDCWREYIDIYLKWKRDPVPPEQYCTSGWFDPNDPNGGTDEDGAPWGVHPWTHVTLPRPSWVNWTLARTLFWEQWHTRRIAMYWLEKTAEQRWHPRNINMQADLDSALPDPS